MGKTERGAVWLDPERTTPFEYYQYWINTEDADVGRFLALFTFLPMEQVRELDALEGADAASGQAGARLRGDTLTHGEPAAREAQAASQAAFGGDANDMTAIPAAEFRR